jgi:hypothetical protein
MCSQCTRLIEFAIADGANVWLISSVYASMCLIYVFINELIFISIYLTAKLLLFANATVQNSHTYGFSPVCTYEPIYLFIPSFTNKQTNVPSYDVVNVAYLQMSCHTCHMHTASHQCAHAYDALVVTSCRISLCTIDTRVR